MLTFKSIEALVILIGALIALVLQYPEVEPMTDEDRTLSAIINSQKQPTKE